MEHAWLKAGVAPSRRNTARMAARDFISLSTTTSFYSQRQLHFTPNDNFILLPTTTSFHSQRNDAQSVREKDHHQSQASDQGAHGQPLHARDFVFHVHEVADDERRFYERQAHQNGQHPHGLHILIRQIDFNGGHPQQRGPNPEELPLSVVPVLVRPAFPDCLLKSFHGSPLLENHGGHQ